MFGRSSGRPFPRGVAGSSVLVSAVRPSLPPTLFIPSSIWSRRQLHSGAPQRAGWSTSPLAAVTPLVLYKHMLRESSFFFDDVGGWYLQMRIKEQFRRGKGEADPEKVSQLVGKARTGFKRILLANEGSLVDSEV
jgi:hypothetical protein